MEAFVLIDIHCHILPALDDGAENWDIAVQMARIAAADGVTDIIATPHMVPESKFVPEPHRVRELTDELNQRLDSQGIPVTIHPGMEVYLTPETPDLLEAGRLLTLADSEYLLVELPANSVPHYVDQVLFEIMLQGVRPILAPVERNRSLATDHFRLQELLNRGNLAQLNASSLMGGQGRKAQSVAKDLVRRGLIQFIASDGHSLGRRKPVIGDAVEVLGRKLGSERAYQLSIGNPRSVLANESVTLSEGEAVDRWNILGRVRRVVQDIFQ